MKNGNSMKFCFMCVYCAANSNMEIVIIEK